MKKEWLAINNLKFFSSLLILKLVFCFAWFAGVFLGSLLLPIDFEISIISNLLGYAFYGAFWFFFLGALFKSNFLLWGFTLFTIIFSLCFFIDLYEPLFFLLRLNSAYFGAILGLVVLFIRKLRIITPPILT